MIGTKVVHKVLMTGADGHYVNNLVNGSRILDFFGDVATELCIRADGDGGLFLGYSEVRFTAPVHVGDIMEYHGWIEKIGNTSYSISFEAWKITTMPDDFKLQSNFLDGVTGKPKLMKLHQTAMLLLNPPELCAKASGTLVIPKSGQRGAQDPAFAR